MDILAAQARATYSEIAAFTRAGDAAARLSQWEVARRHYESALALVPADPHGGELADAKRLRRLAANAAAMAGAATLPRPLKDNADYGRMQREAVAEHERIWSAA